MDWLKKLFTKDYIVLHEASVHEASIHRLELQRLECVKEKDMEAQRIIMKDYVKYMCDAYATLLITSIPLFNEKFISPDIGNFMPTDRYKCKCFCKGTLGIICYNIVFYIQGGRIKPSYPATSLKFSKLDYIIKNRTTANILMNDLFCAFAKALAVGTYHGKLKIIYDLKKMCIYINKKRIRTVEQAVKYAETFIPYETCFVSQELIDSLEKPRKSNVQLDIEIKALDQQIECIKKQIFADHNLTKYKMLYEEYRAGTTHVFPKFNAKYINHTHYIHNYFCIDAGVLTNYSLKISTKVEFKHSSINLNKLIASGKLLASMYVHVLLITPGTYDGCLFITHRELHYIDVFYQTSMHNIHSRMKVDDCDVNYVFKHRINTICKKLEPTSL